MKIIQMPDALANKIAAGEVVERPASVVKELMENSIDANSTWIKLELLEAGLQEIKITDNGTGMSEADVETAFLRHATSKIRTETDLFHVRTLGFRGEALASIASVSRLEIKTSEGDRAGTSLKLEGGKLVERGKSDARQGTEIIVRDLFFNTPARLKYMKTIHTELGHITDLLNRLALSHPEIRFEAVHQGKTLFQTPGSNDLLQVLAQIYGMGTAKKMLPVKGETLDFSITGYVAKPEVTRASRSYISTMINGRYIRSQPLIHAILRAYHTLLPIGRNPIVALSLEMDPILVDVNVHPTKLEARFSKEKELVDVVERTIRDVFRQTTLIPEMEQKPTVKPVSEQYAMPLDTPNRQQSQPAYGNATISEQAFERAPASAYEPMPQANEREQWSIPADVKGLDSAAETSYTPAAIEHAEYATEQHTDKDRIPTMYPIGQLHGTYILAQNENGLYMIDQHAAQERIKYEFFYAKLAKPANESQQLLIPLTFEFTKQETILMEDAREELEKVGLYLEPFGEQTYRVTSHPRWFPKHYEEEVIREMVEQVIQKGTINIAKIREDAAIMMACKGSIKANHHLNEADMVRLLTDLRETTDPFTCPHGRPIIVHFSSYELEKMFKRVM